MINIDDKETEGVHAIGHDGIDREITAVYQDGRLLWELIIGLLFSKDGYSLQSKDGYVLKAKDQ